MKEAVWYRPGSIGDIMMTLNLVDNFKTLHEDPKLVYRCDPVMEPVLRDLILAMGFDRIETGETVLGDYHLVGYPVNRDNPKLGHPYAGPMKNHVVELFARELGVEPDFDSFILPRPVSPIMGDYVSLHSKAGWSPYKNWEPEKYNAVAWKLNQQGIRVIQVGGPGDPKIPNCYGRIMTTEGSGQAGAAFNMSLAAIANARVHLGPDSWTSHATNIRWGAAEKRTPGVILWGSSQVTATGYPWNTNICKNLTCQPCFREDPNLSDTPLDICPNPGGQTYEKPLHKCMADITVDEVFEAVMGLWEAKRG